MSKRSARIELRPIEGSTKARHPHYLRLVASNGQILAVSEPYATRSGARAAVGAWLFAFAHVALSKTVLEFDANGSRR